MRILGLESTCDETGAAIVEGDPSINSGLKILSNVLASSANLQDKYGGVVPEVAAREQVKVIIPVIKEALERAREVGGWKSEDGFRSEKLDSKALHISHLTPNIDAIAISHGPGLIGSLLIGVETAKTLAVAWEKPLIPVNHLVGHIYANWISLHNKIRFPALALIVSGGHTDLVLMNGHSYFKLIGTTLDDSVGEAFDKVAKVLGLSYPGGPEIERVAKKFTVDPSTLLRTSSSELAVRFPRPMIGSGDFDFSFSGLKTAVVNRVKGLGSRVKKERAAIAFEFQNAAIDVLVSKTIKAAKQFGSKTILVGGGVAANNQLRIQLTDRAARIKVPALFPPLNLCVDNGAMIAAAAYYIGKRIDPLKLQANPGLHFRTLTSL